MKKYIGFKLLEAKELNLGDYNIYRGWKLPADEKHDREGYLVKYSDGYKSWSPKEMFEKSYMEIGSNNTVTQEMIDYMIDNSEIKVQSIENKTTIVYCVLPNGFTMVEASSCVDKSNYDELVGKDICIGIIKNKLWELLGFLLQTAKEGINNK